MPGRACRGPATARRCSAAATAARPRHRPSRPGPAAARPAGQRRAADVQPVRQLGHHLPVPAVPAAEQPQREHEIHHQPRLQQPAPLLPRPGILHCGVHQLRRENPGQHTDRDPVRQPAVWRQPLRTIGEDTLSEHGRGRKGAGNRSRRREPITLALRSSLLMMTLRPTRSFFTLFQTHSSGFRSGEYGGRKNIFRRPPVSFSVNSFTFAALCAGWPSTMRKIPPSTLAREGLQEIDEPACVHGALLDAEAHFPAREIADTMLIDFLSPVFTTTGVCPTRPHVVPWCSPRGSRGEKACGLR